MHLQVSSNYQKTWENVIKVANEQLEAGQMTVALDAMDLLDFHVQDMFNVWAAHHGTGDVKVSRFLDAENGRPLYVITRANGDSR
jgi:hypothetical protein